MKYVYMQDNSTPDKVVRRLRLDTNKDKLKYKKFKYAQLIEKDLDSGRYVQLGAKFTEVTKKEFIESAFRGVAYAKANYEDIGLEFDLERQVKNLAKKTGLTQKEIREKIKALEVIEAEFIE